MNKKEIMDLFNNPSNRRLSILIMGGTCTGKTTLANELFGDMDIYDNVNDIKSSFASGSRVQIINTGSHEPSKVYKEVQEVVDIVIYTKKIIPSKFSVEVHKNRLGKMGVNFKFTVSNNGVEFA